MNRDDIARIARESGVLTGYEAELFVRFADAVQKAMLRDGWRQCAVGQGTTQFCAMVEEAVKAEREACAKVCDDTDVVRFWHGGMEHDDGNRTLGNAAAAIRARGEQPKRHPGYIMGDHWLQAAYTRVCTGEDVRDVMADYGWYP